nr:uncharacterized protein LOC129271172 [Lytechinus pictus]
MKNKSSSKNSKDPAAALPEAWHRHYTDQEKRILVQLVLDRIDIIENNYTRDQFTLELKNVTWKDIADRFNADVRCSHQRDTKQIKKLWDNIKTRAKRMVTANRLQKTMRGELRAASSAGGPDDRDLDNLAEDSIAEKVIYYMKMIAKQQNRSSDFTYDLEDDEEASEMIYAEQDYEPMDKSEDDVILCVEEPPSCPPAQKRYVLDPRTTVAARDPPVQHPPSRGPLPEAQPSGYLGTSIGSYTEQDRDSLSSLPFTTSTQQQIVQSTFLAGTQHFTPTATTTALGVTRETTTSTTPSHASYNGGWVEENSGKNLESAVTVSPAKRAPPTRGRRTIKGFQKQECQLRIRKLRLEMNYARIEHEERLKVIRKQRELLDSLKNDPPSIISSMFK